MSDDLTDITGGDPRRARVLRDHLTYLADAPDPRLREMAQAVLNGDVSLRQATMSDGYSDAFGTFWTAYQDTSPDERAELAAKSQRHISARTSASPKRCSWRPKLRLGCFTVEAACESVAKATKVRILHPPPAVRTALSARGDTDAALAAPHGVIAATQACGRRECGR